MPFHQYNLKPRWHHRRHRCRCHCLRPGHRHRCRRCHRRRCKRVVGIGEVTSIAGFRVGTSAHLVGITDAIVVAVVVYDLAIDTGVAYAIDVGAKRVVSVSGGCVVVVAGRRIGTTGDFVGIADAIVIAVVVHDQSIHAGVAYAIDVGAKRVVSVSGGCVVVVAGRRIGTTGDFVGIADAIVIAVVVHDQSIHASVAYAIDVGAKRVVSVSGGCVVVVAGRRIGTTGDFVGIADAIVIAVVVHDQSIHAGVAYAIDVGAERVVGIGEVPSIAGFRVGTSAHLVGIADAIVVAVIVYDLAIDTGVADAIDVGALGVVGVSEVTSIAGFRVGTSAHLVGIADAIVVAVIVYDLAIDTGVADAIDVGALGVVGVSEVTSIAGFRIGTTGYLVGITDAIVVAVIVYDQSINAGVAYAIDVGAERVVGVGCRCVVVVAGRRIGAPAHLIGIADTIVIAVVVYDQSIHASVAYAIDVGAERVVGVGCGGIVVVARRRIGTTGDFVGIADAIVIAVIVYDLAIDTGVADAIDVGALGVVGVSEVPSIAGFRIGTTGYLIGIADTIVIAVVVYDQSIHAGVADAIDVGAERVVGVGCGGIVVVAGRRIGAPAHLIGIADTIVIAVVVYDQSIHAGVADAIDVGAECVVGVCGGGCVVVAGRGIGTTCDLVGITDAVVIAVVVHNSSCSVCFSGAGFATCGRDTTSVFVGGCAVVVAGRCLGTALDFVGVTNAVTIAVVVHDDSVYAGVTHAIDVSTLCVVGVCGGVCS